MDVRVTTHLGGTLEVSVDGESYLVSLQDTIGREVVLGFPKTITIVADEPPLTGVIIKDGLLDR